MLDDREVAFVKVNPKKSRHGDKNTFLKSERKQYANDQQTTKDDEWFNFC